MLHGMSNATNTSSDVLPVAVANALGDSSSCRELLITHMAEQSGDKDINILVMAVALNFAQLLGAIALLMCISRTERGDKVLMPLQYLQYQQGRLQRSSLPHEWLLNAMRISTDQFDIDAQVVVRLCLLGLKFGVAGTLCGCIMIPIYSTGTGDQYGIMRYSLSNISRNGPSWHLPAVVVAAYLMTAVFIWLVRAEWRHFVTLRHEHFARCAQGDLGIHKAQAQHSLMIERIPPRWRTSKEVRSKLGEVFRGCIHSCVLQRYTKGLYGFKRWKHISDSIFGCCCRGRADKQLQKIVALQHGIAKSYRHTESMIQDLALDGQIGGIGASNMVATVHGSVFTEASRSSMTTSGSMRNLRRCGSTLEQIEERVQLGVEPTSTAFVTLDRASDRTIAEQAVLFDCKEGFSDIVVTRAPESKDVVWENVSLPFDHVKKRIWLGRAICSVSFIFWSVPVNGLQLVASQSTLERHFPWLVSWCQQQFPNTYTVVVGYLPVLALMIMLTLLPYVLYYVSRLVEARKTRTEIAISVIGRNLMYQFLSLWLMVVSSSLLASFSQIIDHPGCAAFLLGKSVPRVAVYFITFVVARIGVSLPLLLLRLPALWSLLTGSEPDAVSCAFEFEVTNIAIVFVLALMYCIMAPIIMPACAIYFGLACTVYKWLFLHVYKPEFDLAGAMWYKAFPGIMIGAIFGMLSICGLATTLEDTDSPSFFALWLLPVLLAVFWHHCNKTFGVASSVLPYSSAVQIDETSESLLERFERDYYVDPILKRPVEVEDFGSGDHVCSGDQDIQPCTDSTCMTSNETAV
eukprot:TRINITY_DN107790_c0_g1_i1.p1 TRINITY_DN107790_c0_g1~~TRINITY_DN107790_c0_g1_i1.p1  ORF type:complete len:801 (+),score=85.76 TRINITY_DN107790_c0_g1_i1:59-2461(+)